jgi:hypothetical protein
MLFADPGIGGPDPGFDLAFFQPNNTQSPPTNHLRYQKYLQNTLYWVYLPMANRAKTGFSITKGILPVPLPLLCGEKTEKSWIPKPMNPSNAPLKH